MQERHQYNPFETLAATVEDRRWRTTWAEAAKIDIYSAGMITFVDCWDGLSARSAKAPRKSRPSG